MINRHIAMTSFCLTDNLFVVVLLGVWDHCFLAWLPVCWADFSVLVRELECFHQS